MEKSTKSLRRRSVRRRMPGAIAYKQAVAASPPPPNVPPQINDALVRFELVKRTRACRYYLWRIVRGSAKGHQDDKMIECNLTQGMELSGKSFLSLLQDSLRKMGKKIRLARAGQLAKAGQLATAAQLTKPTAPDPYEGPPPIIIEESRWTRK